MLSCVLCASFDPPLQLLALNPLQAFALSSQIFPIRSSSILEDDEKKKVDRCSRLFGAHLTGGTPPDRCSTWSPVRSWLTQWQTDPEPHLVRASRWASPRCDGLTRK